MNSIASVCAPGYLPLADFPVERGALGLSYAHKRPIGLVEWYQGGSSVTLRLPSPHRERVRKGEYKPDPVPGMAPHETSGQYWHWARRGKVREFSRQSRARLMHKFGQIDVRALGFLPILVTLTYPREWSGDWRVWKRDLAVFRRRVRRKYGDVPGVWKLEFQKRGAPHIHLLLFMPGDMDKGWLALAWFQIVGSGDTAHFLAGTRVERVRSQRGMMSYVAKYMGKQIPSNLYPDGIGRCWGTWHWDKLPVHKVVVALLGDDAYTVRRWLRGAVRSHVARDKRIGARLGARARRRRRAMGGDASWRPPGAAVGVRAFWMDGGVERMLAYLQRDFTRSGRSAVSL